MLTGVLPYQEENPDALVQSIKAGQAIPVSRYRSDVPPRLAELIDQMLQADPAARPETAEGVLVRLTEAAEGDV
jgi:hypothetical protein